MYRRVCQALVARGWLCMYFDFLSTEACIQGNGISREVSALRICMLAVTSRGVPFSDTARKILFPRNSGEVSYRICTADAFGTCELLAGEDL